MIIGKGLIAGACARYSGWPENDVPAGGEAIVATATFHPQPGFERVTVRLLVDGQERAIGSFVGTAAVVLQAGTEACRGRRVSVTPASDAHFVPGVALGGEDNRALSLVLCSIEVRADRGETSG